MRFARWAVGAALAAGCSGGTPAVDCPADLPASCPAGAAGYQATIAPLIAGKCTPCHAPGGQSSHPLLTWAEVHALRGEVLSQVYACRMPQAGAPALTAAERTELLGWLVCEAPND